MEKTRVIRNNTIKNTVLKLISIGISYLSIPIILNFLGEENYGIWITVFTTLSWIYNFDMGVGNAIRNKLNIALMDKEVKKANEYISTGYAMLIGIGMIFLIILLIGVQYVSIDKLLGGTNQHEIYLKQFIMICGMFVVSNFIFKMYAQFFLAIQESYKRECGIVIYNIIVFLCAIVLKKQIEIEGSLVAIAIIYLLAAVFSGIIMTTVFFIKNKKLIPKLKNIKVNRLKELNVNGIEFFIIQICMLVILSTDNIIITRMLGASETTVYNLVAKILQTWLIVWGVYSIPYWGIFTQAFQKRELVWIEASIKKMKKVVYVIGGIICLMIIFMPKIIFIWTGNIYEYPEFLIINLGIFVIIRIYGDIYMTFLNAIGKIKIQMYCFLVGAIINIPLSVILVKILGTTTGVILATNICMSIFLVVLPIQVSRIFKKAKGEKSNEKNFCNYSYIQ